jgi:cobalt-zinc-cadmium resistance protein CzcA
MGFLISMSVRYRRAVLGALLALLGLGVFGALTLPIDAMPDVSTVQVTVLTDAPGLSPMEVESMVSAPIELAFNGLPRLKEIRSVSRPGLSAVTVIFDDAMDVWFARQLVTERLRDVEADLPEFASTPALAPVSTGLGEIYVFVVRSQTGQHTPMQLRTLLDWEIVPRIRSVPGVIEVNTMGGELKQYQVVTSPERLKAFGVTLSELRGRPAQRASSSVGGWLRGARGRELPCSRQRSAGRTKRTSRECWWPRWKAIASSCSNVGEVKVGHALRYGVTTRDGEGEVVTGTAMMLLGANSAW